MGMRVKPVVLEESKVFRFKALDKSTPTLLKDVDNNLYLFVTYYPFILIDLGMTTQSTDIMEQEEKASEWCNAFSSKANYKMYCLSLSKVKSKEHTFSVLPSGYAVTLSNL